MKIFTFYMSDAWGDDYIIDIRGCSEKEAWDIARMIDDDAVPKELV